MTRQQRLGYVTGPAADVLLAERLLTRASTEPDLAAWVEWARAEIHEHPEWGCPIQEAETQRALAYWLPIVWQARRLMDRGRIVCADRGVSMVSMLLCDYRAGVLKLKRDF